MKNIVVFDNTFYIRNRIKESPNLLEFNIIEAENTRKMMSTLQSNKKIDLIIMEINIPQEDGISILTMIKNRYNEIPIIILTSESRRASFIEGIQHGASDYILKPFDDDFLAERIFKHLRIDNSPVTKKTNEKSELSFDFQNFLDKELKKASKGNYEVTLLITMFLKIGEPNSSELQKEYLRVSKKVYPELQKAIFDTDVFTRYGTQSFIGIFPFCSEENQKLIDEKFQNSFEELKNENEFLDKYSILNTFVTFPKDGTTREDIMENLLGNIRNYIKNNKIDNLTMKV